MEQLLKYQNVNACGYGYKKSKGFFKNIKNSFNKLIGKKSIIVFVSKKVSKDEISPLEMIPKELDGKTTDVIEIGEIELLSNGRTLRPVVGGCSAMIESSSACTIGAVVYKNGKPYGLSNQHCFWRWWEGGKKGDKILQPSPADGGSSKKAIATLDCEEHKLILDGKTQNLFDTSLQPLDEGIEYEYLKQYGIGDFEAEPDDMKVGDVVHKQGRTSYHTEGKVLATDVIASIYYDRGQGLLGIFKGQTFVENTKWRFVRGGDSGSLVLKGKRPVGQVFGGTSVIAIVSPIKPIMEAFNFTFSPINTPPDETEPEEPTITTRYVALGKDWKACYVKPLGEEYEILVSLNVRTEPKISKETLIETLPKGTRVKAEYFGKVGNYYWLKLK